jgi:hypothetical protein
VTCSGLSNGQVKKDQSFLASKPGNERMRDVLGIILTPSLSTKKKKKKASKGV